ncbi:MAG: ATP-dependent Clp protease ATP-binding subunit [Polyangiaceae bacterium]
MPQNSRQDRSETKAREGELQRLRRLAEELGKSRSERPTTAHLLVVLAREGGTVGTLLGAKGLSAEMLLCAVRVAVDDRPDAMARVTAKAKDLASRSRKPGPLEETGAAHLLCALCEDQGTAAHRILRQCGVDVGRLFVSALSGGPHSVPAPKITSMRPTLREDVRGPRERLGSSLPMSPPSSTTQIKVAAPLQPMVSTPPLVTPPAIVAPPSPPALARMSPQVQAPAKKPKKQKASTRFSLSPKEFPLLAQLGRNLTELADKGELEPVFGREEEVEQTLDLLARKQGGNPCLLGPHGVGKSVLVQALALHVVQNPMLAACDERVFVEVNASSLLTNTAMRGQLAERMRALVDEAEKSAGRVVLFLEELPALLSSEGDEAAAELRRALARGTMRAIFAMTSEDFTRIRERDAALARHLSPLEVPELDRESAFIAIERRLAAFAEHHDVRYTNEAIAVAIAWSVRYMPYRPLPEKATELLDMAGARAKRRGLPEVTPERIAEVASDVCSVPLSRLVESDGDRLLRFEEIVGTRVMGHPHALARMGDVLRRNAAGIGGGRPIGVFLLLGPTGVGKTESAKAVAECLFGSSDAMTRLDMSEFSEAHSVARLIGAPPGYVGHEAGGQLTEAIRKRPYQVLLLDEIEKAHRDVLESFLQVFDEGRMTDGRGRTVDFSNVVIFLTSNLGAEFATLKATSSIGFRARRESVFRHHENEIHDRMIGAAKAALPAELYNRFDEVLVYSALSKADVRLVARKHIELLQHSLRDSRGLGLDVSDDAVEFLLDHGGFEPELGARPMRRAVAKHIESKIADAILKKTATKGDTLLIYIDGGELVIDVVHAQSRTA